MNTSFTPGPWNVFRAQSSICVGAHEPIQRVEDIEKSMYVEVFGENREANARLIAAAPELLEQLIILHDAITQFACGEPWPELPAARAAINLATGQKP